MKIIDTKQIKYKSGDTVIIPRGAMPALDDMMDRAASVGGLQNLAKITAELLEARLS